MRHPHWHTISCVWSMCMAYVLCLLFTLNYAKSGDGDEMELLKKCICFCRWWADGLMIDDECMLQFHLSLIFMSNYRFIWCECVFVYFIRVFWYLYWLPLIWIFNALFSIDGKKIYLYISIWKCFWFQWFQLNLLRLYVVWTFV